MTNQQSPVLITGVGKRIGLALCKRFLQQGIPVIGTYRTYYPALDALGSEADLIQCDFYQQESLTGLIADITGRYSQLRAIIHNASDWIPESADCDYDKVFGKMMQIHAGVPYQLNFGLAELLKSHPSTADIIHITDYVAEKGSRKHIAYAASKAALSNMTLSFSALLAPAVKVNAIAPSMIMFNPDDQPEYRAKALDKSLLKTAPGADEVITAVDYLLQSSYMTGRTLSLDGGRHIR
jgi:dihydromonapterin reductase/dihydrofolate reductase